MDEEDDLYESLPPTTTAATHMFAGALAGVGEHCVMYPFDCVKVYLCCFNNCYVYVNVIIALV